MPKLSDTMVEGVIVAWHKEVGDVVESGELLAEIETDKATMELESFYDGKLLYVKVGEDGSVPVGELLAIIGEEGEDVNALVKEYEAQKGDSEGADKGDSEGAGKTKDGAGHSVPTGYYPSGSAVSSSAAVSSSSAVSSPFGAPAAVDKSATALAGNGEGRIKASPLAKAMAKERGLDLNRVPGTGPDGRIVKRDIEDYKEVASSPAKTAPVVAALPVGTERYTEEKTSQMRKTIARRLGESKFSAPHFYLTMEIDMEKTWEVRKAMNEVAPVKISFNDLIVKAASMALRQHPKVNSSWMGDVIRYNEHIHIGVAVAVDEGLLVPVVRFADSLSLSQISNETRRLAGMARDRKLQPSDWEGNTFTISNLGMFGIEEFTAIINTPDACIMAVGAIRDVPVVKNGEVVPGKTMKVTLSCDHRVVDGAIGSAFLKTFKLLLEDPVRMLV